MTVLSTSLLFMELKAFLASTNNMALVSWTVLKPLCQFMFTEVNSASLEGRIEEPENDLKNWKIAYEGCNKVICKVYYYRIKVFVMFKCWFDTVATSL